MKKFRIVGLPQAPTYRTGGVLNKFAPGGAPCPRGQIRDASGKCVAYNWGTGNVQAADSYTGMYGGYDSSGTKNLPQVQASAKKGKKFSDYILRGGKTRADVARNLGKNAGAYFGMPGEALEPVNFTKAGLDKFTKDVKNAEKGYEAEEKNRKEYEKALKKKESGKMSTDKFAQQYNEKGWANYDPATMKEGYEGQFQDAVDEANARKAENMGVTMTALELMGGGAGYRVLTDPLGTAKGVAQTVGDVATLPVGLGEGIYNYATKGDFDMGVNPLTGANYGEGVSETFDALGVIPGIGGVGKLAKFTKAGDLVGDTGKFLTTKTPLKNTYKLLGNDSKFFNPGEVPHWRKGYQEVWDPEIADLSQLDEFAKSGTLRNLPKEVQSKYAAIGQDYGAKIKATNLAADQARASGNIDEAIRLSKENFALMNEKKLAETALLDAHQNSVIQSTTPFQSEIGKGSFGKVYDIKGSNKVVKIGRVPSNEDLYELIERGKDLRDRSNIAITTRQHRLPSGDFVTVMNKVDDPGSITSRLDSGNSVRPTRESYQQLVQDIKDLQDRGLYVDFQNTDNIVFNPKTGKFNIYDLNTTGHYMSRRITPEMGYSMKRDPLFKGIEYADPKGISVPKLLRDHSFDIPLDIQKRGGATNDYIELDIPEDKIQHYLNNGYNVEEVAVPMMANGGTPSDIWYQYTGTPWSEAKAKGLTDGTMEQNLALVKRLQAGEFGEPKIVDTKSTPTVTPYDQMVFALVKQGNSLDDLVKQRVGTREGLIFKYPELFANKKNVSAPKKPGPKPKKGTTIMEQFDALSKFASPYIDKVGDAVSTAYDSWINRMSKISEQEAKTKVNNLNNLGVVDFLKEADVSYSPYSAKQTPSAPTIDMNKLFPNKMDQLKKFAKPEVQQKQVIEPYDMEALRAQLTQSNMAGAPPSLTRQPSQQPLGNNSAAQFAEYGQRGQGIENTSLDLKPDPELSLWDAMSKLTKDISSKETVEEKPPVFDNSISSQLVDQEWLGRQQKDYERYSKFMSRGRDIANRTDVQRNVDSEKFFADMAKPNSVIIDIGSALGNSDPKLAGVSVWELTQNPKIKQKKIKVIATDIPDQVKSFKEHAKNKKAYNIDYAEVPMTFNTPIDNILKSKNLTNTKDVYLRAANSIDLLMTVAQTKEHFYNIAKKLKNKNVTYVYNNMIWYKPAGETSWSKIGNINNAAYDHNAASWKLDKNRKPYALTGDDVRNPFNN